MTLSVSLKCHTLIFYEKLAFCNPQVCQKVTEISKFLWLGSGEGRRRFGKGRKQDSIKILGAITEAFVRAPISELVFTSAIPKKWF